MNVAHLRPGGALFCGEPGLQLAGILLAGRLRSAQGVLAGSGHPFGNLPGSGDQDPQLAFEGFLNSICFLGHDRPPFLSFRAAVRTRLGGLMGLGWFDLVGDG